MCCHTIQPSVVIVILPKGKDAAGERGNPMVVGHHPTGLFLPPRRRTNTLINDLIQYRPWCRPLLQAWQASLGFGDDLSQGNSGGLNHYGITGLIGLENQNKHTSILFFANPFNPESHWTEREHIEPDSRQRE